MPFYEIITNSSQETENAGEELVKKYKNIKLIALFGKLGAGKTAFSRGIARAFGSEKYVCSPTYTIVNEYPSEIRRICHFDMYRISSPDELYDIGWDDYLSGDALCIVEWSENVLDALPKDCVKVSIEHISDCSRKITINLPENSNADNVG